jgi:hypothetical protein
MLSDIAQCEELFHTASGTAFADFVIAGHRETWPIRSKRFRAFLKRCYYHATGQAASAAEIRSTLDLLEARAQFDGPQRSVHVRTAEQAGHIFLDLAGERWRAVDIGPDGWRVIASSSRPRTVTSRATEEGWDRANPGVRSANPTPKRGALGELQKSRLSTAGA